MKVEMFDTQKSAMPLLFSNFDFLPIYKADSAGSRTYPFENFLRNSKKENLAFRLGQKIICK